jgi:hypothetical protein
MVLGTTVVLVTAFCIPSLWGYILLPRPGSEVEYFSNTKTFLDLLDQDPEYIFTSNILDFIAT